MGVGFRSALAVQFMNSVTGRCALCLKHQPLKSSHLLPKALYRFVTKVGGTEDPNPVIVTRKVAWQTSKQVEAHLLCFDCEQRFHKLGEDWTLRHCYRGQRRFRLQDILGQATPAANLGDTLVFAAARIPGIDMQRLGYFAASVFWRASVHRWHTQDHHLEEIDLGKKYSEEFRKFLLGKSEFPRDAALLIDIFGFQQPTLATMAFPYGGKREQYHFFKFTIPGVAFNLFVGSSVPQGIRKCCALRSPEHIIYSSMKDDAIVDDFINMMRTAKPSHKLKCETPKRSEP